MNLSDIAIRRPVFTTMVMVAMMILGMVGYSRLSVELFPDISFPVVTVTTPYPGAGPEEVEQMVTRPIEDAVGSLEGVDSVRSFSREGVSVVVVMFDIGTDVKMANVDVRDRATAVHRRMPDDVEESTFMRLDPSAAAVMTLVISGNADPRAVRTLADDVIKPILERSDGVAAVTVRGGEEREIQVQLSAEKLARWGLTVAQVSQALALENANVPTGRLDQGAQEASLRLVGEVESVAALAALPVATIGDTTVTVGDLGVVVDTSKERRSLVRVDGKEAVAFDIMKQSGGNSVAAADGVKEMLPVARAALPPGITLDVILDTSLFISENADHVQQELIIGALSAIAIIFLFMLDWRSTFISALALPTSIVTTFFGMYLAGFSLNMMSLMGLSLSVGFLVDDAIVVRENIFRHIEMGEDPFTAASKGTKEIALAVLATTATILAVFIPVGFTSGMIGQMFQQFALTVAIAVSVSLFVAFTVDPMLSARLVKPHEPHGTVRSWPVRHWLAFLDGLDEGYRSLLARALRHRWKVLAAATMAFVASFGAISMTGSEFFPKADRGEFVANITLPPGTSLDRTTEVVADLEGILRADPETRLVYATIGASGEARKASLRVRMIDKGERSRSLEEVTNDFRAKFGTVPGIGFAFTEAGLMEGDSEFRQAPIMVNVRGADFAELSRIAEEVRAIVAATPGTTDIDTSFAPGLPELQVHLDRDRAAALGITAVQAGSALRSAVVGDTPTRFREGEEDYDVRVGLREADRGDIGTLESLSLLTRKGPVPLRQVATVEHSTGPATIEREARQRQITVSAGTLGRSLGEVVAEIESKTDKLDLPEGYVILFGGQAEQMAESGAAFGMALVLAIIFIYVVLASQFESFIHPVTIMVSLPLAIVGAFVALFLTGSPMGMSTFIGVILLMGLVTKNAILLVDRTNQLRDEQDYGVMDALLEAGPTRLRPIIMTSATIVLGMLPTAISDAAGSEFRAPMAIAVIGGVVVSTVLTLVVVPVVYTMLDRFTGRARAARKAEAAGGSGTSDAVGMDAATAK
ncbi:MAG: efflux RND transporter permease subunit [Pseudomonadota bacterium]|nr:efflux RND transporter permease subunit [Pseudomonadota bacterium]